MGISYGAKRVKEAAQLWEPMAKYIIASNTAADAAAVAERDKQVAALQWGAERRTKVLEVALNHHATALNSIRDAIGTGEFDLGDPTNLGIYTQAFSNFNKTQRDYYESAGITPTGDTITHLTPFFSSIFDDWSKDHPNGDPAALKWGKEKGVWGDVIKKLDPDINRDDAHAVWEKIWKSKFGDGKKRLLSEEGLIGSSSLAGVTAEVLGAVPDFFTEFGEGAAELSKSIWEGKNYMTPLEGPYNWGDRTSREYLRELFGVESGDQTRSTTKPIITPSGKYTPMGPFASPGFLSGATDYMRGPFTSEPFTSEAPSSQDIKTLDETLKSLEEIESDAQERVTDNSLSGGGGGGGQSRDRGQTISQEAASFLAKLLEYMTAYGPEEARVILSEEFSQLSGKAKNELQSYLMTESEALA